MILRKQKEAPGLLDKFTDQDKKQILHGLKQLVNSSSDEGLERNSRMYTETVDIPEGSVLNSVIVNRSTR